MPSRSELSDESLENKLKYFYRAKTDFTIDYNIIDKEAFALKWSMTENKIGNGS